MKRSSSKYDRPGRPPNHDPIMDLKTQKVYKTYAEAARDISGSRSNVLRVLRGTQRHHKGHKFKYVKG